MGVDAALRLVDRHERIGLDSCVLVYHLEDHPSHGEEAGAIISHVVQGGSKAVLSTLVLLEIQVGPYRKGLLELADEYYDLLRSLSNCEWVPVTYAIADRAARLRARHGLRTPDAIQLATAIESGASLFVTDDRRLARVPGLQYLVLR